MKDKLRKIKQVMRLLNDLGNEFNASHKNKTIEFMEEFEVDEDGFNFKVRRVIPEEDTVEIIYDVFEGDEQIKCTEFITFYEFIKYVK